MLFQEIDLLAQVWELKTGIAETILMSVLTNKIKDSISEAGNYVKAGLVNPDLKEKGSFTNEI